ncbi:MAG: DNA recombination protein RmuC [Saprospiraceae bacterium]|jgi:DNA recombination protein RmuC
MSMTTSTLIACIAGAFALGAILSYLIGKNGMIRRSVFEALREKLGATQNELDTHLAIETELRNTIATMNSNLRQVQAINQEQKTQIAQLDARFGALNDAYIKEESLNKAQQQKLETHQELMDEMNKQIASYTANNQALLEKLKTQKDEMIEFRSQSNLHFEKIANQLLEEKSSKFVDTNKLNMEQILAPLKTKIKEFEAKVETTNKESIARHSSLGEMIKQVNEESRRVAKDANNLAKALKGDFKKQGNWGELILSSLLDKSGLQKDREYFLQKSERDADGALQKPDVVIELPDNKKIVIDSKVSLVAYDAMVAADDETDARKHRRNHALAIKNHINGLSAKNYHALYQVESPDYVLMFIPIDTAFSSAVSEDHTLFEYAFNKNIIIVTASTLLLSLKTFESLWKNEKQNKNALTIAAEAGKMYDKFAGFVEDMRKMGQQLNTVQKTYDGSMKKLSDGSGNLVRRAEKIKQLGANTNKVIAHTINDKLLIEPIG